MEQQFLAVLQQDACGSLYHALGAAGGAGGVHDVERLLGGELGEFEVFAVARAGAEVVVQGGAGDVIQARLPVQVGDQNDPLDGRDLRHDPLELFQAVEALAGVEVAVSAEKHLRLDLAETVQYSLDAEVRRAGGPGRADADAGQHGDYRLGEVGHKAGYPVSRYDPGLPQGLRQTGYRAIQLGVAQPLRLAFFTLEYDRRPVVAKAQQVFGKVEPGAAEPVRAGHAGGIVHYLVVVP